MSNYNLSLTGAQVNSALNKVHNADTQPTNGSTNMVTSDAVHDAVNNIGFNNLDSSLINTDMSAGTSANTLPTSAAVSNAISTNRPNQLWLAAYKTYSTSSTNSDVAVTNFNVYKDNAINISENTSNGGFFMPTGHYQVALSAISVSGSGTIKLYYTPAGGSYTLIGQLSYSTGDVGAGSLISIRNSGTLYVKVINKNNRSSTSGEVTLTLIKLTDY